MRLCQYNSTVLWVRDYFKLEKWNRSPQFIRPRWRIKLPEWSFLRNVHEDAELDASNARAVQRRQTNISFRLRTSLCDSSIFFCARVHCQERLESTLTF